jgi:hypothetical protein
MGKEYPKNKHHSAERKTVLIDKSYIKKIIPNNNDKKKKSHITDYNNNYTKN